VTSFSKKNGKRLFISHSTFHYLFLVVPAYTPTSSGQETTIPLYNIIAFTSPGRPAPLRWILHSQVARTLVYIQGLRQMLEWKCKQCTHVNPTFTWRSHMYNSSETSVTLITLIGFWKNYGSKMFMHDSLFIAVWKTKIKITMARLPQNLVN
jgi:hypothetical protein